MMGNLAVAALAAALGAGLVLEVQAKKKAEETKRQADIALNKDLDNEALRSLLKDLLGGYVTRHGVFEEDEAFSKRPDPRHVRVIGVEQGRARAIWDRPLKSVVGEKARESRELADLLTAINLDLPDHMTKLREETRNLSIKRAELEAQYHDLCAQNADEKVMIQAQKIQDQHDRISRKIAVNGKLIGSPDLKIANIQRSKRDLIIDVTW